MFKKQKYPDIITNSLENYTIKKHSAAVLIRNAIVHVLYAKTF